MSSASLPLLENIESLLWGAVQHLPVEYQKDFEFALYNSRDQRLIGTIWSLKWDGQQAYLI